jgi:hypothetical protein
VLKELITHILSRSITYHVQSSPLHQLKDALSAKCCPCGFGYVAYLARQLSCLLVLTFPVAGTSAQFATYSTNGLSYEVNIPSSTASGNGNTIFFQLKAPSGTQWIGLGQGSSMDGANIVMVYAAGDGNVTLSPRSGVGQTQPQFNSAAKVSLLEGSGVLSDGSMIANVRCDSCLSWSGGSMSPTDANSAWIWSYRTGDPIDSTDTSANLLQHVIMGATTFDLPSGTGGSSSNPFVVAAANPSSPTSASGSSTSATDTAVSTQTFGSTTVIVPVATPTSSSGTSSSSSSASGIMTNVNATRTGHAIVMSLVFLVLMPFAALTLYLPYTKKVPHIHAPLQILNIILAIVGLALGVRLAKPLELTAGYHQLIGYVVVGIILSAQPILGLLQHLHFRSTGNRSGMGVGHKWLGRIVIITGVVNGGLGMRQSGPVGDSWVPNYAPVAYSVVAAVVFVIYVGVVVGTALRKTNVRPTEKYDTRGYEMHPSSRDRQQRYDQYR